MALARIRSATQGRCAEQYIIRGDESNFVFVYDAQSRFMRIDALDLLSDSASAGAIFNAIHIEISTSAVPLLF